MRLSRRRTAALLRLLFLVAFVAILEYLCRTGRIARITMVPPSEMVAALFQLMAAGRHTDDILFTFTNIAAATALAVAAGGAIGVAVHALPRLRAVLDPIFGSYYAVPTFVFYPILIVLLGVNRWPLVVIGAMFGVVAMVINTMDGLDRIPRVYLKAARAHGLSRAATVWRIKVPAAAPYFFTGFKLAITYSFIGVIAGEFILSVAGLGRRIAISYNDFETPTMYALLVLIVTVVVTVYFAVRGWEARLARRRGAA